MNTTTWTPTDLLGLGSSAMRPCTELDYRTVIGVSPAPRVAPFQGTGVPADGIAARLRPAFQARPEVQVSAWNTSAHNSIDTFFGIHTSGRPLS